MTAPNAVGVAGNLAVGGAPTVTPGDLMRIIYEADIEDVDPIEQIDFSSLEADTFRRLTELLQERGTVLTEQERDALVGGQAVEKKRVLAQLRLRAHQERIRLLAPQQPSDGITQSRYLAKTADDAVPEGLDAIGRVDATGVGTTPSSAVAASPAVSRRANVMVPVMEPESDPAVLGEMKQQLLSLVTAAHGVAPRVAPVAPGAAAKLLHGAGASLKKLVGIHEPEKLPTVDTTELVQRAVVLGETRSTLSFKGGFPPGGRSGQAGSMPIMQFVPDQLLPVCKALGIRSLVDVLTRGSLPPGRAVLSRALGVPRTTMLLATHRAELLDLPVDRQRANYPHLKDVLLLSRLGVRTVAQLEVLHRAFSAKPARIDTIADLIAIAQKADPNWVGRQRITRHDLRHWALASSQRGSDIVVATPRPRQAAAAAAAQPGGSPSLVEREFAAALAPVSGEVELDAPAPEASPADLIVPQEIDVAGHEEVAEQVLQHHLTSTWADPDQAFADMAARALTWLASMLSRVDDALLTALTLVGDLDARRLFQTLQEDRFSQQRDEEERYARWARSDREVEAHYGDYVWRQRDWSLLMGLAPWMRPDGPRQDGRICFWVDPIPDLRQTIDPEHPELIPESLQAVYLCLDPASGAIAPFGAGL